MFPLLKKKKNWVLLTTSYTAFGGYVTLVYFKLEGFSHVFFFNDIDL